MAERQVEIRPLAVVKDVPAASRWFQQVLGLRSAHGGDEYEMLCDGDVLVLQLHRWDAHEHPFLGNEQDPSRGNGLLLWFLVPAFDALVERVQRLGADILDGPLVNPNAQQRELWLRGPEGYAVVAAGRMGDLGSNA